MNHEYILELDQVKTHFKLDRKSILKAVDGASLKIKKGETLGLVGESGCGKSTLGRTAMKFYEPTEGRILFEGQDISKQKKQQYFEYTKKAQMVFQDPYASLDARMPVGEIIAEGMKAHKMYENAKEYQNRSAELLELVGLHSSYTNRFIHEFSGGQRQRIGIARALSVDPRFIVCDEPISALDVSIQAQVVNLFLKLQEQFSLTYLFIAHDLSIVKHVSDHVAVMYLGKIVEIAPSDELYKNPLHPYTKALISAIPIADPKLARASQRILLEGDVPNPINTKPGCKFASRCRYVTPKCYECEQELKEVETRHFVACNLYQG